MAIVTSSSSSSSSAAPVLLMLSPAVTSRDSSSRSRSRRSGTWEGQRKNAQILCCSGAVLGSDEGEKARPEGRSGWLPMTAPRRTIPQASRGDPRESCSTGIGALAPSRRRDRWPRRALAAWLALDCHSWGPQFASQPAPQSNCTEVVLLMHFCRTEAAWRQATFFFSSSRIAR